MDVIVCKVKKNGAGIGQTPLNQLHNSSKESNAKV